MWGTLWATGGGGGGIQKVSKIELLALRGWPLWGNGCEQTYLRMDGVRATEGHRCHAVEDSGGALCSHGRI